MAFRTDDIIDGMASAVDSLYLDGEIVPTETGIPVPVKCKVVSRADRKVERYVTNMTEGEYVKVWSGFEVPAPRLNDVVRIGTTEYRIISKERNTRSNLGLIYYLQVRQMSSGGEDLRTDEIIDGMGAMVDTLYIDATLHSHIAGAEPQAIRVKPLSRSDKRLLRRVQNETAAVYLKVWRIEPALHDIIEAEGRYFRVVGERNIRSTLGNIHYTQVKETEWVQAFTGYRLVEDGNARITEGDDIRIGEHL